MLCSVWLKDYKVKEGREEGEGGRTKRKRGGVKRRKRVCAIWLHWGYYNRSRKITWSGTNVRILIPITTVIYAQSVKTAFLLNSSHSASHVHIDSLILSHTFNPQSTEVKTLPVMPTSDCKWILSVLTLHEVFDMCEAVLAHCLNFLFITLLSLT